MATRRVDEVLEKAIVSDPYGIPRFDLIDGNGNTFAQNVKLVLKNPVIQAGMPVTASTINEVLAASGTTGGTATVLTLAQTGFGLLDGAPILFRLHTSVSSGATLNINNTGAFTLQMQDGFPFVGNQGAWYYAVYNSSLTKYIVTATMPYRVGDMLLSAGAAPAGFALCNGGAFDPVAYPSLNALIGKTLTTSSFATCTPFLSSIGTPSNVAGGNGYVLAVMGNNTVYGGNNFSVVATQVGALAHISRVVFTGNAWFALAQSGYSSYACSGTDPINGTWTALSFINSSYVVSDVVYGNGKYVIITNGNGYTYASTNPTSGYSSNYLGALYNLNRVATDGTYFVAISNAVGIFYSTDGLNWTRDTSSSPAVSGNGITFGNGYWVVAASNYVYYKSGSPSSAWTQVSVSGSWVDIIYCGGQFVMSSSAAVWAYSTTPNSWSTTTPTPSCGSTLSYGNGKILTSYSSTFFYMSICSLPSIFLSGAYAYIKAQ